MTATFIPRGQEGILLRGPLTHSHIPPSYRTKSLLYSRNIRPYLSHREEAGILENGSKSHQQRTGFYTRHNPHPGRVRHMKGLLDVPICVVEDNYERRLVFSAPTGEDYSTHYRPPGNTRYSANKNKHIPAIGIVPVTYAWKDELEKKAQKALNRALGEFSNPSSQQSQRNIGAYDHLEDEHILDLLCRILQTNSISACHAWLQTCSESEKIIVLNMLRMAASGEIDPYPQHLTTNNQSETQSAAAAGAASKNEENKPPSALSGCHHYMSHSGDIDGASPFRLPQHDTIIRDAHSRLMSRGSERTFHERLQTELDQEVNAASFRLNTPARRNRSSPLVIDQQQQTQPIKRTHPKSFSGVSATEPPPPPVHVHVTQERLQDKGINKQQNKYY